MTDVQAPPTNANYHNIQPGEFVYIKQSVDRFFQSPTDHQHHCEVWRTAHTGQSLPLQKVHGLQDVNINQRSADQMLTEDNQHFCC